MTAQHEAGAVALSIPGPRPASKAVKNHPVPAAMYAVRKYEYCPVMQSSLGRRGHQAPALAGGTWRNWAGNVTATPARWATPRTEAEISASVNDAAGAGLQLRALGSGHSFTPAAATDGLALDLSGWTGIIAADTRTGLVTVRSGTTLRALNAGLAPLGLALANLGDIDVQTVAGALATGTHGTGARLGGLATQIEALDLVLADGSLTRARRRRGRSCSRPRASGWARSAWWPR